MSIRFDMYPPPIASINENDRLLLGSVFKKIAAVRLVFLDSSSKIGLASKSYFATLNYSATKTRFSAESDVLASVEVVLFRDF